MKGKKAKKGSGQWTEIQNSGREKSGSESMFQQLFGKIPEEAALFTLAAAPESARMTIGMDDNGIYLELIEPIRFGLTAQLRIVRTPDGKIELRIDDYRFLRRAARGHGIGTGLFIRLFKAYRLSDWHKSASASGLFRERSARPSFRGSAFYRKRRK